MACPISIIFLSMLCIILMRTPFCRQHTMRESQRWKNFLLPVIHPISRSE